MRGRPIGTVISSVSLGVLMLGAFVFALVLVATSRNIANTGLMGPFGLALVVIAFGFSALFAAIALWQLETWAWPFAMVVGVVGLHRLDHRARREPPAAAPHRRGADGGDRRRAAAALGPAHVPGHPGRPRRAG